MNDSYYVVTKDYGQPNPEYAIQMQVGTGGMTRMFRGEKTVWTSDPNKATRFLDPNVCAGFVQRIIHRDSQLAGRVKGIQLALLTKTTKINPAEDYDRAMGVLG